MKKIRCSFLCLLFVLGFLLSDRVAASAEYDAKIPQLVFAAQELEGALTEAGRENLLVSLIVKPDESSPEAFSIRSVGPTRVEVTGTDATGAMYGGLEVADLLRLGLPIENQDRSPFVPKRGIKFNIPLDARTPSYDDTGDSAQKNIETMWDFEFWKAYLDDLARYRYNVLSLWTTHPFPSMIKLEDYPDVSLDDVYRISDGILEPHHKNKLQDVDFDKPGTLKEVEKEVVTVQQEGDFPEVRFTNLADGARVPAETELRVEVDATDGDGIPEVKLYLNGLLLKAHATKPQIWSGSSDELLKALKPGMYHLEAVAEDKNGLRSHREIQITVGNVPKNSTADWKDEIHQVILNEDERLMDGEIREFPRLECFLTLEEDGRLALFRGAPRRRDGLIWKTRGKADRPTPQPTVPRFYAFLENGQMVVYRGTPDNPDVILWQSSKPSGPGPYKLGISASRRLVVFRDVEGDRREIVWRSPVQN